MEKDLYKKYYDKLNLHFQLLAGLSIALFIPAWLYVENSRRDFGLAEDLSQRNIGFMSLVICLIAVIFWHFQYSRKLKNIDRTRALMDRLNDYRKYFLGLIIKMCVLSALLSISYIFLGSDAMIAAYSLLLVMISMNRLTYPRIARQLKMTKEEREVFFGS